MKSFEYLFLAVILIVVITISISSKTLSVLPYNNNTQLPQFPYEGFTSIEYTSSTDNKAMDSYKAYLIDSGASGECKKVFGFDGLYCDPNAANKKLDVFGEASGGLNCSGSGLTNSKGSLCLDDKMTKLLMSRGGNALGGDSQIGTK